MNGFSPIRTTRTIASCIAALGMFSLFIECVLSCVLEVSNEALQLALARYNNFTGRFAASNFAEDKQLLTMLHDVQNILPTVNVCLIVLLVFSIILIAVAVLGFAFPRQFAHILVALKVLRWQIEDKEPEENEKWNLQAIKKAVAVFAGIIVTIFAGIGLKSCIDGAAESKSKAVVKEMNSQFELYIQNQKSYFAKNKTIGSWNALKMDSLIVTDDFTYQISSKSIKASLNNDLAGCPAKSAWKVTAITKGVFNKELAFQRLTPSDSKCGILTPDFKNIGRKR